MFVIIYKILGDRLFPPQTGLTYSTWICVDKFSDPRTDPHCVRLLTLVRTPQSARDLICLTAVLSARDKAIIVSTQETPIPQSEYTLKVCVIKIKWRNAN